MAVAARAPRDDRHLLAVMSGAREGRLDGAAPPRRHAPDERQIGPLQRPGPAVVGELRREPLMRPVVLGDDEKPGRVLVEPVHDAGPLHAADARTGSRRNGR